MKFLNIKTIRPCKILISKRFSLILLLAWLLGFIPIKFTHLFSSEEVNELSSPRFYKNIMLFYSFGMCCMRSFTIYIKTDNWLTKIPSTTLSRNILHYFRNYSFIVVECCARIYLMLHPSLIIQVLNVLKKLTNMLRPLSESLEEPRSLLPNKLFNIGVVLCTWNFTQFCMLQIYAWIQSNKGSFWRMVVFQIFDGMSISLLPLFELAFIVLLGMQFTSLYRKIVRFGLLKDGSSPKQVFEYFKILQGSLDLYNRLVGYFILTNMTQNCFATTYGTYYIIAYFDKLSWTTNQFLFVASLWRLISLITIVQFGEYVQNVMKITKDKIQDVLGESKLLAKWADRRIDEKCAVAKYILEYKWELTACGLFKVDVTLLPMVIASITYN